MKFQTNICLIALIANVANAFTPTTCNQRSTRALISSRKSTAIRAASDDAAPKKKKAVKKKAATKKKAAAVVEEVDETKTVTKKAKEDVETFRKPEFIASIAEKTGMSKADSEAALAAVLETISEVSAWYI